MIHLTKDFHDLDLSVHREVWDALIDTQIGSGQYRNVYTLRGLDYVLKIERPGTFCNALEWETWGDSKGTWLEQWLAPCVSISGNGRVLLMKRTEALIGELPVEMPAVLSDFKVENYGRLDGRVVCHDYGGNLAINHSAVRKKMKPVQWWSVQDRSR